VQTTEKEDQSREGSVTRDGLQPIIYYEKSIRKDGKGRMVEADHRD
jgi:hypothetical protein